MTTSPQRPHGEGPGVITPDGCAVDFYAALPPGSEPETIHRAIAEGASILELGAGAGRVTHPLLALGHPVVAVDESPEMLEHIHGAETVVARIEELDLNRRFDAVVLASYLVNVPDRDERRTLLAACRRHVADDGCVLMQRHEVQWFDLAEPFEHHYEELPDGQLMYRMRDVSRPGPGLVSATMEYHLGDRVWTQSFTSRRVDDDQLADDLAAVGLRIDASITDDRTWVRARPAVDSGGARRPAPERAPASPTDLTVAGDGVTLAVRDFGGQGTDVLLLHGGGRTMEDWRLLTPILLRAGLRVAAMDLRGHGRSTAALWSWPAALADVAAVVERLGMDRPALVGHSLGGIVAAIWAAEHPECPLAVNGDGHPSPLRAGQFAGLAPAEAEAAFDAYRQFVEEGVARSGDPALTAMVAALDLDLLEVYRRAESPVLMVCSEQIGIEELLDEPMAVALDAFRRGFNRDLAALARQRPNVSAAWMTTDHDLPLEDPDGFARIVLRHLGDG
jgi:pimeloyl-ACP methyl ester carboxylesterase/SAM-dependent methyltransferase